MAREETLGTPERKGGEEMTTKSGMLPILRRFGPKLIAIPGVNGVGIGYVDRGFGLVITVVRNTLFIESSVRQLIGGRFPFKILEVGVIRARR